MARTTKNRWTAEARSRARQWWSEHLRFSPHDYVDGISRAGDRAFFAEQLTADLPEQDDLRFEANSDEGQPVAVVARRLPWDSDFFGFGVARLEGIFPLSDVDDPGRWNVANALEQLIKSARKRGIAYLFAAVDPRDLGVLRALGETWFALIESRLYHWGPIIVPEMTERFPVRRATLDDLPSLARTARETVNAFDRFHADPFFPRDRVDQLMERWVEESVRGTMADLVVVPDVASPSAFATYRYLKEGWPRWGIHLVQGVLSAVDPAYVGWMGRLGPEVNYHLKCQGATHSFGSTQVTNRSIIWFAQDSGGRMGKAEHIFRKLL